MSDERAKRLRKGDVFYTLPSDPNDPPYKCHVCAIIDEKMVVYKWYGKHKQWWHYQVQSFFSVGLQIERHRTRKEKLCSTDTNS